MRSAWVRVICVILGFMMSPEGRATEASMTQGGIVLSQLPEDQLNLITIDGRLDEPEWQGTSVYDQMTVTQPDTLALPVHKTEVRFLYSAEGLYVGVHALQPPETRIARLSARDDSLTRDGIALTLDTSGEGLYAYWFGLNLGGSLEDGKVAPEREFSREWDGPWVGATAETPDGWTAEMFLPWSMMAMPDNAGMRKMGIYLARTVAYRNERWTWPALPQTKPRFMSTLQPIEMSSVNPQQEWNLYPFAATTFDGISNNLEYRVGADIFWRPSSNVQIAATINPDFGTVESDDVVVNLTAFETFFPEKRLFFLEGNEVFNTTPRSTLRRTTGPGAEVATDGGPRSAALFSNNTPTTLVNTRRIGGRPRRPNIPDDLTVPTLELNQLTELLGAAKVTGQLGDLRYGALAAFEDNPSFMAINNADASTMRLRQEGRDFFVLRGLYEHVGSSRRSLGWIGTAVTHPDREAFVQGIDAHYQNGTGNWKADAQLIYSHIRQAGEAVEGAGGFLDLAFVPRQGVTHKLAFEYFDTKLAVNDLGFLRRNDSKSASYTYSFRTARGLPVWLRSRSTNLFVGGQWSVSDDRFVRGGFFLRNAWEFQNRSQVSTEVDFFPGRWDDRNSRGNGEYKLIDRWVGKLAYGTNTSKRVSISMSVGFEEESLSGATWTYNGGMTWAPNDRFSLVFDVNYKDRRGWLVYQERRDFTSFSADDLQPRLSLGYFLSARQQIKMSLQWAGVRAQARAFFRLPIGDGDLEPRGLAPLEPTDDFTISRLTAQIRYRWEIAPLSDLFVVYTRGSNIPDTVDNEFGSLFHDALIDPIVNGLVIKLRYRFGS